MLSMFRFRSVRSQNYINRKTKCGNKEILTLNLPYF